MAQHERPLQIAIIGGGITGVALGLALLHRDVRFTIYERARNFREIGAGIAFNPTAVRAMRRLSPRIVEGFERVVTRIDSVEPCVFYVDGFSEPVGDGVQGEGLGASSGGAGVFWRGLGEAGAEGCRRADFLEGIVRFVPGGRVRFGRNLVAVEEVVGGGGGGGRSRLRFEDGSCAEADVVIGCDGIKSRLRRILFGEDNPVSHPGYSHRFCFRAVIPMDKILAVLGDGYRRAARTIYTGRDAHLITYPIAGGKMLNVGAFVYDPEPWTSPKMTIPATRAEAVEAFAGFGPVVRAIVSAFPQKLDKWGIFDLLDNPLPRYSQGNICLAGDAAHASSPHHGAGAGLGIEDALLLAQLLSFINRDGHCRVDGTSGDDLRYKEIELALSVYNDIRYERTQWVVESSRKNGDISEWRDESVGSDHAKFEREEKWRMDKVRSYDTDLMVEEALDMLQSRLRDL